MRALRRWLRALAAVLDGPIEPPNVRRRWLRPSGLPPLRQSAVRTGDPR